ncbi:MAG TPA: hypothetical protein DCL77_04965 [Prolixibacteraceae bacterium]|jgi:hypothetical protein|nr:hypothetical protein [Prolixibacteraceae bacterium]
MNLIEKRDFIQSRLHQADESLIDEFYEMLRKEEVLKTKLISRALKSENDIKEGKVFSRTEIEQRTNKLKPSKLKMEDFINKWSGFLSNPETDNSKFQYLGQK